MKEMRKDIERIDTEKQKKRVLAYTLRINNLNQKKKTNRKE